MSMRKIHIIAVCIVALAVSSCAAKKAATATDSITSATTVATTDDGKKAIQHVQKVADNALYQQNVVAKMSFNIQTGSKDITVPGSLHMRKDEVIRMQLFIPIIGSEVGRIEFTKDYVMIVDRMHKQFIKADYNQIDFLRDKGLTFYSLQALFWNQLFQPGEQKVSEAQLQQFAADLSNGGSKVPVTLKQGAMTFVWNTDKATGRIDKSDISYVSSKHGTTSLEWTYDDFQPFGSKRYPNHQSINIKTTATTQQKDIKLTLDLSGVSADSDWETRTTVSDKYKQVSVEEVVNQMMKL